MLTHIDEVLVRSGRKHTPQAYLTEVLCNRNHPKG